MRTILLAGYNHSAPNQAPWLTPEDGLPTLERRIRQARSLGMSSIVVLAGDSSEEGLRRCPSLEHCELVFDTHGNQANLLTNLRAALHLGFDPALVLPAELPFGGGELTKSLRYAVVQEGFHAEFHVCQAIDKKGSLINQGFPLALTARGCKDLMKLENLSGLNDERLIFHRVSI